MSVRHVRTPAGVRKYGQPIGSVIVADGTSAPMNEHGDYELPLGLPNPAMLVPVEERPRLRNVPRDRFKKLDHLKQLWEDAQSFTGDYEADRIRNETALDALRDEYGLDYFGGIDGGSLPGAFADDGAWVYWDTCRKIRQAAWKLVGYDPDNEEQTKPDWALHEPTHTEGGWSPELPDPDIDALVLLDGVHRGDATINTPAYRGMMVPNASQYLAALKEGDTFDMPLASFVQQRSATLRFGEDVTFVLQKGAKGVYGGLMEVPTNNDGERDYEEYEDETYHEFVSGGRFKIIRTYERQPYGYTVVIKQVGTFDPRTGMLTKQHHMGIPWFDHLFDFPLASPKPKSEKKACTPPSNTAQQTAKGRQALSNAVGAGQAASARRRPKQKETAKQKAKRIATNKKAQQRRAKCKAGTKSLPEFKDIVRTQAGVDKYHQPIGSFIVKDAVLPYLDVTEAVPDKLYYAQVHDGPMYKVRKLSAPVWARWADGSAPVWQAEQMDTEGWPEVTVGEDLKSALQSVNDLYDLSWVQRVTLTPPPADHTPIYPVGKYQEDHFTVPFNANRSKKTLHQLYEATMGDKEIDDPTLRKYPYEAFESDVVASIKQQYQDANDHTVIYVPDSDVLKSILVDGRFKSQFETGTSSGLMSNERRESVEFKESKQMLIPASVLPKERPIYGAVEFDPAELSIASRYGRVRTEVTNVEGRVTATLGDSLDWTLIPVTPDETDRERILASAAPHALRYLGQQFLDDALGEDSFPDDSDRYYVEVQIHGGLGVDNITAVSFPYRAYDTESDLPASQVQVKRLLEHMHIDAYDDDRLWGDW